MCKLIILIKNSTFLIILFTLTVLKALFIGVRLFEKVIVCISAYGLFLNEGSGKRLMDKTINLLMVEDDPGYADLLRERLSEEKSPSFRIHWVNTLEKALERLQQDGIDVIMGDLSLPDSKGLDTFEKLNSQASTIPIVILTGTYDESFALESLRKGAEEYLLKGQVDTKVLSRILRYAIERHQIKRELALANTRLENLALLDPLTELLNRRGLQDALSREIQRAKREGSSIIVLLVDLDNFKQINDTLGHAVGDVVLKELAQRLKETLRVTDYLARIGGDEFMMILPQTRLAEGMRAAERVRLAISQSLISTSSGNRIVVTGSVGVASVLQSTPSIDELLAKTHLALRQSKEEGKNKVSYERRGTKYFSEGSSHTLSDIFKTLRHDNGFQVLVEPIINLKDGQKAGYELLSHFHIGGFEAPDDFFRFCLEHNILTLVDHRCFEACVAVGASFPEGFRCHLNLFPSTLINIPVEHLLEGLPTGTTRKRYCIEISEQQIIGDPSYLMEAVKAFKQAGVSIAIDDVGFGRSCLESLILLEPDLVKIDKKCVMGISKDKTLMSSLIRILKVTESLGAEVVVEGVETQEDLNVLKQLPIKYGQGFFWGRPVDAVSQFPQLQKQKQIIKKAA